MAFFSDMREDLSQTLNELMQLMPDEQRPKEKRKLKESMAVVPEKDADKKIDAERKLPLNEKWEKLDDFQMSKMEQEQHGVWRDTFESEFLSMAELLDPMDNESSTMSMENNTFEKDKEENSMELEISAKGDIPMNEKTPKIEKYGKLFGDWEYKKTLYENKNGTKVLQIYRKGSDWEENCAVKVIPIIDEYGEWDQLPGEIKESYLGAKKENCKKAEKEVRLMYAMRGCSNIVSYYDYAFVEWSEDNRFGCDLLIRMELLDCLRTYIHTKLYSEKEIMKIGIDICRALVQCHKKNIIHRDIKPENVFINEFGDYLLGDFGIARILNNAKKASTSAGTFEYMAPEQMKGNNTENYGSEVDIYSLGLTLYELANEGKLPFAKSIRITQAENALRLSGKKIPLPNSVSEELANIILKACEYDASKRYQSADELLRDLMRLDGEKSEKKRKEKESIVAPNNDGAFTTSNDDYATALAETVISPEIISGKDDEENKFVVTEKKW